MRKLFCIAVMALLALSSCSSDKRPEVFIEESQMIDILTDAYLLEARLNLMKSAGGDVSERQVDFYNQLFEHYGITDTIFEENMNYYTHHPSILERMMDSVNNRFIKANN
ncbi:MAG: DUF4296 domain-containing protein [Bacteroidales bacterium]|nr:DUF4296 domain-containing protein [Bacteroidales bacterium]